MSTKHRTSSTKQKQAPAKLSAIRAGMVVSVFAIAFAVIGGRLGWLAVDNPRHAAAKVAPVAEQQYASPGRADIVDRDGRLLAATVPVWSLYAHPREVADPRLTAVRLAEVFTELDIEQVAAMLDSDRRFVWLHKEVAPREKQRVYGLGLPGLYFGVRQARVYPAGSNLAHVLGGTRFDNEGVKGAELVGVAGVEHYFDERLRAGGEPVRLSVDLPVQAELRDIVHAGVAEQKAKGAAAVLLEVNSGEVISMISLPDFDPNHRPNARGEPDAAENVLFNRAAQGVYELGSTLKPVTAALAMEFGGADLQTSYHVDRPLRVGGYAISDLNPKSPVVNLREAVFRSSNIATASAALAVGAGTQRQFLKALGFMDRLPLEISEARGSSPLYPNTWRKINVATIAYGHGIAITPLHLAAGYATLVGDGRRVVPTLVVDGTRTVEREQVVSEATVAGIRTVLRDVVRRGTGRKAEVAGYAVGGKTGTADKVLRDGRGYEVDKVIATFAAVFPAHRPAYVLVVTLDEPEGIGTSRWRRAAGNTAAPVAAAAIDRIAPMLGVVPSYEEFDPDAPEVQLAQY